MSVVSSVREGAGGGVDEITSMSQGRDGGARGVAVVVEAALSAVGGGGVAVVIGSALSAVEGGVVVSEVSLSHELAGRGGGGGGGGITEAKAF